MKTDTCTFEKCYFADLLDKPEQCPNFMENWFYPNDSDPYSVKDCAPKRQVEMLKDIYIRLTGVQKSNEEQRNASTNAFAGFAAVFQQVQKNPGMPVNIKIPRLN